MEALIRRICYSYLRYSHPQQRKGESVRRQLEWSQGVGTQ